MPISNNDVVGNGSAEDDSARGVGRGVGTCSVVSGRAQVRGVGFELPVRGVM